MAFLDFAATLTWLRRNVNGSKFRLAPNSAGFNIGRELSGGLGR